MIRGRARHAEVAKLFKAKRKPLILPSRIKSSRDVQRLCAFIEARRWQPLLIEKKLKRESLTGIVDAVFLDTFGNQVIVDWKFQRKIAFTEIDPDNLLASFNNDNAYILQLNLYRWLLNNPRDSRLYVVQISSKGITSHECPTLTDAQIKLLLNYYLAMR